MLKPTVIIFGIVVILIIGLFIYPFLMISAVYPPLREYEYPVSALKLQSIIFETAQHDTSLLCNITDTTGAKGNFNYYMNIKLKKEGINYLFCINYNDKSKFWNNNQYSELGLVGVFDSTNHYGGYQMQDKGVEKLIDIFDKNFISQIETKFANLK